MVSEQEAKIAGLIAFINKERDAKRSQPKKASKNWKKAQSGAGLSFGTL